MMSFIDEEQHPYRRRADTALLALLLTAFIHLAGSIWWASDISRRVANVEHWAAKTENIPTNIAVVEDQLARFNTQLDTLNKQLERIGNRLQEAALYHAAEEQRKRQ